MRPTTLMFWLLALGVAGWLSSLVMTNHLTCGAMAVLAVLVFSAVAARPHTL